MKCSFPARNSLFISKILPTWSECKGFYLGWWILIGSWVCHESAFSGSFGMSKRIRIWVFVMPNSVVSWWCMINLYLNLRAWLGNHFQRLLKMVDGLNFKDFVAFLSAFSAKATIQHKIECKCWLSHDLSWLFVLLMQFHKKGIWYYKDRIIAW